MPYVLESDAGRRIAYADNGPNAVLVFSTPAKAQARADDTPLERMKAVELTAQSVNAWVAKHKWHGATGAIMDATSLDGAAGARRLKFAELIMMVYAK